MLSYYSFENIKTIFIISTGRTGTKFFQNFFCECFHDVFCVHEPYPDFFSIGMRKIREKLPAKEICKYIKSHRKEMIKMMKVNNQRIYIESNPQSIYIIPELIKTFKNIKFLFIVRDPKEVVSSLYNLSPINNTSKMLFYDESDHRKRICPHDFSINDFRYDWNTLNRIGKISWYWNKANSLIYNELMHDNNTIIVKFEDLFTNQKYLQKKKLVEISRFLGLFELMTNDWNKINLMLNQKINETKTRLISKFSNWSDGDKDMMLMITREMREVFNYT